MHRVDYISLRLAVSIGFCFLALAQVSPESTDNGSNVTHLVINPAEIVIQVNEKRSFAVRPGEQLPETVVLNFRTTVDNKTEYNLVRLSQYNVTFDALSNATHTINVTALKAHQKVLVLPACTGKECPFDKYVGWVDGFRSLKEAFIRIDIVESHILFIISGIIGWIYFVAWSISFYPQMVTNWRRKSVVGLDFNFIALNLTGFACYSAFNCALYWNPEIQKEYFEKNPFGVIPVQPNDIFFGLHAAFATLIVIAQCAIYERANQRVSKTCIGLLTVFALFALVSLCLALTHNISWLQFIQFISYIKLTITLLKYIPQVCKYSCHTLAGKAFYNYRRKSTIGWSIENILLDFTGGSFSLLQMFLDSYNYNDWLGIFEDFTKFGLGAISIIFDVLFIIQHYVLYTERERPLLSDASNPNHGSTDSIDSVGKKVEKI